MVSAFLAGMELQAACNRAKPQVAESASMSHGYA